jgi:hypothetical protein
MTLFNFLTKEFKYFQKDTTFFLGNGINNYCKTTSSWKKLLIELAKKHINKKGNYENILNDNSITYPEFFDIIQLTSNVNDTTYNYKTIKKSFKEGFEKWTPQNVHTFWTKKFIELDRPVLTTNYDYLIEFSNPEITNFVKKKQYNKKFFRPLRYKNKKGRGGFTPYYPWHNYYSYKEIKDARNEFAIWHIHGFYEYYSSIRLGLSDYMGIVEKARKWMHKSNGNPFHKRENIDKWVGNNSWLDIFLNNNLLFIGIDLGIQETSLRWLLIEREKLYRKHPSIRKKTWYVLNKSHDKFLLGKRLFFEKLKIEIIEANNFKQIYETTPKRLKK